MPLTLLAAIGRLEIGGEVAGTRSRGKQIVVWNTHATTASTGTLGMQQATHVDVTSEVSVVARHAPADRHAAIASSLYHNHLVRLSTARVQLLHQAVVASFCYAYNHDNQTIFKMM